MALHLYQTRNRELLLSPRMVYPTSTSPLVFSSHLSVARCGTGSIETTNLTAKTCSCCVYQQTGVPCCCAIASINSLGLSSQEVVSTQGSFFAEHMSSTAWRDFYDDRAMGTLIPADSAVETRYEMTRNLGETFTVDLKMPLKEKTSEASTRKRYRSNGETGNSGIKKTNMPKRFNCESCGKELSKHTEHGPSACDKFARLYPSVRLHLEMRQLVNELVCTIFGD